MSCVGKDAKRSIVVARFEEAREDKDWGEVADIIDTASEDEVRVLTPMFPDLIGHHRWLIRVCVVDAIGYAKLQSLASLVKDRLKDKNPVVRSHALMAYYDLLGPDALSVVDSFCAVKDVELRVTALVLRYLETSDCGALRQVARIVERKRCPLLRREGVMSMFEQYCPDGPDDDVIRLYKRIVSDIPMPPSISKWMKKVIKKWQTKKRTK